MMRLGPIGTTFAGHDWDEKGRTRISHIFVSWDDWTITSIQFGFIENGVLALSNVYGKPSNRYLHIVSLNPESEFLTGLSGKSYPDGIFSLTFHTNQKTYGPFSAQDRDPPGYFMKNFDFRISDGGEFGGFFGTSSSEQLETVGFYFTPKLPANPHDKSSCDSEASSGNLKK